MFKRLYFKDVFDCLGIFPDLLYHIMSYIIKKFRFLAYLHIKPTRCYFKGGHF